MAINYGNAQANNNSGSTNTSYSKKNNNDGSPKEKPVGYVNIKVKAANGEYYTVKAYIPIELDNNIHKGMYEKSKACPDHEFEAVLTVHIPSTEEVVF